MNVIEDVFGVRIPVIGVVHLKALPGAPLYQDESVADIAAVAVEHARAMVDNGVNGLIVENFGDVMFQKRVGPEVTAAITFIGSEIARAVDVPMGFCVLQSDAIASLAIAKALNSAFVRVPYYTETSIVDAGMMDSIAAEALRYRKNIGCSAKIFADVHIKHSYPLAQRPIELAAEDCWHRGLADAVIITGLKTGGATDPEDVKRVRRALPDLPLLVGSGVTEENVFDYIDYVDGIIIASSLNIDGKVENGPDPARIEKFVKTLEQYR